VFSAFDCRPNEVIVAEPTDSGVGAGVGAGLGFGVDGVDGGVGVDGVTVTISEIFNTCPTYIRFTFLILFKLAR
jgi:hypothetical protein